MPFKYGERVEHASSPVQGTVIQDNGTDVQVVWDDGQIGWLTYSRRVAYDAHKLIRLAKVMTGS